MLDAEVVNSLRVTFNALYFSETLAFFNWRISILYLNPKTTQLKL